MKLIDLLKNIKYKKIIGYTNIEITDIKINSNQVVNGSLFVCINGGNFDSHEIIYDAIKYGAVAFICERELKTDLPQIIVEDSRKTLSLLAKNFYNEPDKDLKIIGITGTNGKTTTSFIIKNIFDNAKISCGLIGTLGVSFNDKFFEADLTTPDPLDLYRYLYLMKNDGVQVVVMEVSAHALELNKIEGLTFEVGVFTNLTQDHLDYFINMEKYAKAKIKLFENNRCKYIVSNNDDSFGRQLENKFINVITYGIDNPCDNFAIQIKEDSTLSFTMNLFDKIYDIKSSLIGKHNVYNILASASTCAILKVDFDTIKKGIENLKGVDGRLEVIYNNKIKIYIDYAHTPDGLEKSLLTLKKICSGKLICVFGCGGNRDSSKREIMGEVSGKIADFTIITSDNPRFEEPFSIISQIENGILKTTKNFVSIEDREEAIKYAIERAKDEDIILIAGKGAEKYQDVLGVKQIYNDRDVVDRIMTNRV